MTGTNDRFGRGVRLGSLVALTALAVVFPAAAQDGAELHPAHIHSGTCETLGDVVAPLADVALPAGEAGESSPASALPVKVSVNRVDLPLQAIIDGGHAINIHESADAIDVYIACGAIGGPIIEDELVIGLGELNDSGHTGVARLQADGDATDVTIYLVEGGAGAGGSAAAQDADPAAEAGVAVEIKDFAFNPPSIDVPVGGSITWTNGDNVPHTATGLDRAMLQSGAIAFDASYTQAFETAGTYEYFCEFHPNMKGTIVVE